MGMNNPVPLDAVDDILRPSADANPLLDRGMVDHFTGCTAQLGAHRFHVANDFRTGLLCCRNDAGRRSPL